MPEFSHKNYSNGTLFRRKSLAAGREELHLEEPGDPRAVAVGAPAHFGGEDVEEFRAQQGAVALAGLLHAQSRTQPPGEELPGTLRLRGQAFGEEPTAQIGREAVAVGRPTNERVNGTRVLQVAAGVGDPGTEAFSRG